MPNLTKTPARKRATKRAPRKKELEIAPDHIATRAYFIHLEEGGDPQSNWLRAERELVPA